MRFGKLVIIQRVHDKVTNTANLKVQVRCECDCGQRITYPFFYLVRTHVKPKSDCGQCKEQSFKMLHEYTHRSWYMMNYRCKVPTHIAYKDYGGRGIKVCSRWSWENDDGFENFVKDMGDRPKGMSIDRKRNQGHYEPGNCKWSNAVEQRNNQGRIGNLDPDPK